MPTMDLMLSDPLHQKIEPAQKHSSSRNGTNVTELKQVVKAQLHEQAAQIVVFTTPLPSLLEVCTSVSLERGRLIPVSRARGALRAGLQMACNICRQYPTVKGYSTRVALQSVTAGQWETEIFFSGQKFCFSGAALCLEGEITRSVIMCQFMGCSQQFG